MITFWKKLKLFVSEYWQLLLGFFALVFLLIQQMLSRSQQKDVLANEIEAAHKLEKINEEFDKKIVEAEHAAAEDHDARVREIKSKEVARLKAAKVAAAEREAQNTSLPPAEFVKRFAETFGAEVVEVDEEN